MYDWHVAPARSSRLSGSGGARAITPRPGEDMRAAVRRECLAVRDRVALFDASTLGKIEVNGRDAARFLDRITINHWQKLGIGHCRYALLCREDGMVFDDGVATRLAPDRFFPHDDDRQCRPNHRLARRMAADRVARSRGVLYLAHRGMGQRDLGRPAGGRGLECAGAAPPARPADFPFMRMREADVAGIPARIFRVSFSGELSYEINVPADHGQMLWEHLIAAGMPYGITPYGTEAMHVAARREGLHHCPARRPTARLPRSISGSARLCPATRISSAAARSAQRHRALRSEAIGRAPAGQSDEILPEGAQLVAKLGGIPPVSMIGHVTSSYWGARLGRSFALALVEAGRMRHGEPVWAPLPTVSSPPHLPAAFYDPAGHRRGRVRTPALRPRCSGARRLRGGNRP